MKVIPFVHQGLGNSSYLIGLGDGKAAVLDADRSVERYFLAAEAHGWQIVAAFETHLPADFVSGARELVERAATAFLPAASAGLPHRPIAGGDRLSLAGVEVEVIASPGHAPEHVSYVLRSGRGPATLFSGGALTAGGAGRTDLIGPECTEHLTRAEYRTLRKAFGSLPDDTLLYPTHGGGSFCTAGEGGERVSTLGRERATNLLLAIDDEHEFVRSFPSTFPGTPAYFSRMREINRAGPCPRTAITDPPSLSVVQFDTLRDRCLVVDARSRAAFMARHVPGSLGIPLRDAFALWLGWTAPPDTPLLFVADEEQLAALVRECLLVGYERLAGWLAGGMVAWEEAGLPVSRGRLVGVDEVRQAIAEGAAIVDVREPHEFAASRIDGAINVPLGQLASRIDELARGRPMVVYCGVGDRATTAASVLEQAGITDVMNLEGGFGAWERAMQTKAADRTNGRASR